MRPSPARSIPSVGFAQAWATQTSPFEMCVECGAAYASFRPVTNVSPFVATIGRRVGEPLRMARRLGRSRRTTLSFESRERSRTDGSLASIIPTRTDWIRPPVVRIVPTLYSIPGASSEVEEGVNGTVTPAKATWPTGIPAATRPSASDAVTGSHRPRRVGREGTDRTVPAGRWHRQ